MIEAPCHDLQVRINAPASMDLYGYRVNLRSLRGNVPIDDDRSQLTNLLDRVYPVSKRPPPAPKNSKSHNLGDFEVYMPWRNQYAGVQIQLKSN